jgi:hypothetical protein
MHKQAWRTPYGLSMKLQPIVSDTQYRHEPSQKDVRSVPDKAWRRTNSFGDTYELRAHTHLGSGKNGRQLFGIERQMASDAAAVVWYTQQRRWT